eukprot:CAMPEP_0175325058 /NCGR_PEP_ID=MMETSP0093-20121207/73812_1 /TAXON_ID=311494 /ORGANISM="Alexandrium monilatum, Strain CCMP3105" /LENGTH=38 /DNA_ID= /DNA_START= /DNA_END= /DNA_ORIENTATION=
MYSERQGANAAPLALDLDGAALGMQGRVQPLVVREPWS